MNRKSIEERAKMIQLLVEGNSVRGTSRIMDCSINTVLKLLVDAGRVCDAYQDKALVGLPCKRVQVDEIWSFCYAKNKNLRYGMEDYAGDLWTFTAICRDTKIVPCWYVGQRNAFAAKEFIADLAPRLKNRIHLSSDGFTKYPEAVEEAFGPEIDYNQIYKIYDDSNGRYQRSVRKKINGADVEETTTAHVERLNLTLRSNIRRFTRRTNAHSKKAENHGHHVALHFMVYNFVRIHSALRVTPAMAAGITKSVWAYEDVVALMQK